MQLPLANHNLIRDFNEIKRYFRKYETDTSRTRIRDFYRFARIMNQMGYEVAFDFVGSLNFGLIESYSDVDFILYIYCKEHENSECIQVNCKNFNQVKFLIFDILMKEYVPNPYHIQIVDYINLRQLDRELNKQLDYDFDLIFRFAFYRSICRGVNLKVLKPYHKKLLQRKDLLKKLEPYVDDVISSFNQTTTHNISFEKYRIRLNESGIKIPFSVVEKIKQYLYSKKSL